MASKGKTEIFLIFVVIVLIHIQGLIYKNVVTATTVPTSTTANTTTTPARTIMVNTTPATTTIKTTINTTTHATATNKTTNYTITPATPTDRTTDYTITPATPTVRTTVNTITHETPTDKTTDYTTTPATRTDRTTVNIITYATSTDRTSDYTTTPATTTDRTTDYTTPATSTDSTTVNTITPATPTDRTTDYTITPATTTDRPTDHTTTPESPSSSTTTDRTSPATPTDRTTVNSITSASPTDRTTDYTITPATTTDRPTDHTTTPEFPSSSTTTDRTSPATPTDRTTVNSITSASPTDRTTDYTITPATTTDRPTDHTTTPEFPSSSTTTDRTSPATPTDRTTVNTITPETSTDRTTDYTITPATPTDRTTYYTKSATTTDRISPSTPTDRTTVNSITSASPTDRTTDYTITPATTTDRPTDHTTTPEFPSSSTTTDRTSPATPTDRTTVNSITSATPTDRTTDYTITPATPTDRTTDHTTTSESPSSSTTADRTSPATPTDRTTVNTITPETSTDRTTYYTITHATPTDRTTDYTNSATPTDITTDYTKSATTTDRISPSTPTDRTTVNTITPETPIDRTTDYTITPATPTDRNTANTTTPETPTTITIVTTSTPVTSIQVLSFSLTINETFDFALNSQSSNQWKTYTQKIEASIDQSYRNVSTYQANSATVTGFRPGSVIADFNINATSANPNLVSANQELVKILKLAGFNVDNNAISRSVKDGLYYGSGNIYPGTNLTLSCNVSSSNAITWTLNGNTLQSSNKYVINSLQLTVNNATPSDSGQYACTTIVNSMPYVIWQSVTIQPYPNFQVTTDKVVECADIAVPLQCCVQEIYRVNWNVDPAACIQPSTVSPASCLLCNYTINKQSCLNDDQEIHVTCQLTIAISGGINTESFTIRVRNKKFTCSDGVFGAGSPGQQSTGGCSTNMVGTQVAVCDPSGFWNIIENNCVLGAIQSLKNQAENLQVSDIPKFMSDISSTATLETQNIVGFPATITTIAQTLAIISNLSPTTLISESIMEDVLNTVDIVGSVGAQDTWVIINENYATLNASSELLNSTEIFGRRLSDKSFNITTNFTSLNKVNITSPFSGEFGKNLTTQISFPEIIEPTLITVIISSAFNNILPARNLNYNGRSQTGTSINGDVVLIETNSTINNISFSFEVKNKMLGRPQCVFWNFHLLNDTGGWDSTGCQLKSLENETEIVTCECNHTTSFSILMSPFTLDKDLAKILAYITYIGVGISMVSLVLCLLIEIIIWKSVTKNDTSFMRHVFVVNIALSLLIADICFIIGAAVVDQGEGPCSTATFFMHFFYLALFFWMMLSALFLLYRTFMVFSKMSKGTMMAIAFTVGYGAPLTIAVITVASTVGKNGYIEKKYKCWLNWSQTKALLAFVIPALTIVAINLLVLIMVLCKMLRRGVNASTLPNEKHPLLVIARCVGILTPLFGLTWGFGIGTLVSSAFGIHVLFTFLNSLQGFFILLFGTLLDSKVQEALAGKALLKNLRSNSTKTTSAGPSSSSELLSTLRLRKRYVYNVSKMELLSLRNLKAAADSKSAP